MKMIKVIIVFMLTILTLNSARAAEFSILPWPDTKMDFVAAINLVKENSPSKFFLTIWGWERLESEEDDTKSFTKEFDGTKYAMSLGLDKGQYFGITVIDTVKRVLPSDIEDIAWDDEILLQRYTRIVTRLKNELKTSPDYFVIANETDVYFNKHPEEIHAFLKFAAEAKKAVKEIFPNSKVGFTVTFEALYEGGHRAEFAKRMIDLSDIAFITYYPAMGMRSTPPEQTPTHLDLMIKIAGTKPIALQEIGYPSGIKDSSEAKQARFFEVIIPAIRQRPQIKFVSIFALHDFDDKTCSGLTSYYGFEGLISLLPEVKDFQTFLCSLGLKHADGSPKPAWQSVVNEFSKID